MGVIMQLCAIEMIANLDISYFRAVRNMKYIYFISYATNEQTSFILNGICGTFAFFNCTFVVGKLYD